MSTRTIKWLPSLPQQRVYVVEWDTKHDGAMPDAGDTLQTPQGSFNVNKVDGKLVQYERRDRYDEQSDKARQFLKDAGRCLDCGATLTPQHYGYNCQECGALYNQSMQPAREEDLI